MIKQFFAKIPRKSPKPNATDADGGSSSTSLTTDVGNNGFINTYNAISSRLNTVKKMSSIFPASVLPAGEMIDPQIPFKDVQNSDKLRLLISKLNLCSKLYDFQDKFICFVMDQGWMPWRWSIKQFVRCKLYFLLSIQFNAYVFRYLINAHLIFPNCRKRVVNLKVLKVPEIEHKVITTTVHCFDFFLNCSFQEQGMHVLYKQFRNTVTRILRFRVDTNSPWNWIWWSK